MVSLISCTTSINKKDEYFIDKDFKNIIDKIIVEDRMSKYLTIYLEDGKVDTELWIFGFGFFKDCENIKSIFEYNDRTLIFINNSNKQTFDSLIDINKVSVEGNCELLLKNLKENSLKDFKSFSYLYKNNKLYYLNNYPIEYKNDTVLLNKFIIDTLSQ